MDDALQRKLEEVIFEFPELKVSEIIGTFEIIKFNLINNCNSADDEIALDS